MEMVGSLSSRICHLRTDINFVIDWSLCLYDNAGMDQLAISLYEEL